MFCIHDENDASLACVEKLRKKYPNVDAQVFTGGKKVGVNPKINNMYPGYAKAKYDYILISDSGIRSKCVCSHQIISELFVELIIIG